MSERERVCLAKLMLNGTREIGAKIVVKTVKLLAALTHARLASEVCCVLDAAPPLWPSKAKVFGILRFEHLDFVWVRHSEMEFESASGSVYGW